ncbi:MAG: hypothetical protein AABY22_27915 [Nanoarchaeota archaeon]
MKREMVSLIKKIKGFFERIIFWFKHGWNLVNEPYEDIKDKSDFEGAENNMEESKMETNSDNKKQVYKEGDKDINIKYFCHECNKEYDILFNVRNINLDSAIIMVSCNKCGYSYPLGISTPEIQGTKKDLANEMINFAKNRNDVLSKEANYIG